MGKQINYYMDYESFLKVAQTALDEGCLILRCDHTEEKQTPSNDISAITHDCCTYFFYLPQIAPIECGVDKFGNYYVKSFGCRTAMALIEAGYSKRSSDSKEKSIYRSRLYVPTDYYIDGEIIKRSEEIEKIYNKLVRTAKKVAPSTAFEYDTADAAKGVYKEYISAECMKWVEEGYETNMLRYQRKNREKNN